MNAGFLSFPLAAILLAVGLSGCTALPDADVLATFEPLHFLTAMIAGDTISVAMVIPRGAEPHDWEPSVRDIARIDRAELVVAQGLGFEPWLDGLLRNLGGNAPLVVRTAEGLSPHHLAWEHDDHEAHDHEAHDHEGHAEHHDAHVEHRHGHILRGGHDHTDTGNGDQTGHGHDHGRHDHTDTGNGDQTGHGHDHGGHDDAHANDPHTWLDPVLFAQQAERIGAALAFVFPAHAETFARNTDDLLHRLEDLHNTHLERLSDCRTRHFVTQHDAFGHLAARYGLTAHPVTSGGHEAEPDIRTVDRVIRLVRDEGIRIVFSEELVDPSIMQAIGRETGAEVRLLSPLEVRSSADINAGLDHIDIMYRNLERLATALDCQ